MLRLRPPGGHAFIVPLLLLTVNASALETPDFTGVWMPDGQRSGNWPEELPYTPAGRAAAAFEENYPRSTFDPGGFCVFEGMPMTMFGGGYWIELIQRQERLTIVFEVSRPARRIYTDDRGHPEDLYPTKNGHSVGHWENGTLVVETVGLVEGEGPIPASETRRIVERISLEPDDTHGSVLVDELTIHDASIFTEPVVISRYFAPWPDDDLLEYECTDGAWRDYLRELKEQRESAGA